MKQHVYFAECLGRIKIGISQNVKSRLNQLRTGAGAPVTLIATVEGGRPVESALHKKLKAYQIEGEWYRDCTEVRAAIQNSLNNFPKPKAIIVEERNRSKIFGQLARLTWPHGTESQVAKIAQCDVRTARRWISGEIDAPAHVWAVMFAIATNPNRSVRER